MKYKIGVFGSFVDEDPSVMEKAKQLSVELSRYKDQIILVVGACAGIPHTVAREAAKLGVEVWGFSSECNEENQLKQFKEVDISIYKEIKYLKKEFEFIDINPIRKKFRNIILTHTSDAGIVVAGRWGTMNEFTLMHDMGKVIGVLTGTGGIADGLKDLYPKINKKTGAQVVFDENPSTVIDNIIGKL